MASHRQIQEILFNKETGPTGSAELEFKLVSVNMSAVSKVLVINPTALGDVVASTALAESLKNRGKEVHFLAAPPYAFVGRYSSAIAKVHVLPPSMYEPGETSLKMTELEVCINALSAEKFDLIINIHPSKYSARILAALPAPYRLGQIYEDNRLVGYGDLFIFCKFLLPYLFANRYSAVTIGISQIYHYIGQIPEYTPPRLVPSAVGRDADSQIIGIVPGAAWESKRWPPEYFARLINMIHRHRDWIILLIASPEESRIVDDVLSRVNDINRVQVSHAQYALADIPDAMYHCCAVITNDTGPMHIANALGVPVICLNSSGDGVPIGNNAVMMYPDVDCLGCGRKQCDREQRCIDLISPETVFEIFKGLVSNDFNVPQWADRSRGSEISGTDRLKITVMHFINRYGLVQIRREICGGHVTGHVVEDILSILLLHFIAYINSNYERVFHRFVRLPGRDIQTSAQVLFKALCLPDQLTEATCRGLVNAREECNALKDEFRKVKSSLEELKQLARTVCRGLDSPNRIAVFDMLNDFETVAGGYSVYKYIRIFDLITFSRYDQDLAAFILKNAQAYTVKETIVSLYVKYLDVIVNLFYNLFGNNIR